MAQKKPKNTKDAGQGSKTSGKNAPSGASDEQSPVEDNATPISQAAYARRCVPPVSPQYIGKLVKAGQITLHDGKIIPHLADKQRKEMFDPAREHRRKKNTPDNGKEGSVTEGEPDDFSDKKVLEALKDEFTPAELKLFERVLKKFPSWTGARRIGEGLSAQNELLKYQEARGLLVEADEVESFWMEKLALVKAQLMSVPKKMAQQVGGLVLKYAAQFGRELSATISAIKKKKSGKWSYNKKSGAIELYSGKTKKPFAVIALSAEAPEHAETMVINETETALATEVHAVLNELAGEKKEDLN